MEMTIKNIPSKVRTLTEEERLVINRAMPFYQLVLGQYEKYTEEQKQKDIERLSTESGLNENNPFVVKFGEHKYEPSKEETMEFVYSSWADAIANVKTPVYADGKTKKKIRKQVFREIQNGKYLNRKVRDTMQEYIAKLQ